MNSVAKSDVYIDWCERKAALWAVKRWHYSTTLPRFKLAHFGVWQRGTFVGAVIFGCGATPEIGKPFGVTASEATELVRVACGAINKTPISRIISICVKKLRRQFTRLRVIVSFADESQGHHGGIYQAMGWIYTGRSRSDYIHVNGKTVHPKTLHSKYGVGGQSIPWLREHIDQGAYRISQYDKHKYVFPLDEEMRSKIEKLGKPYPKRVRSVDSDTTV
jgi:hypothetical protein